MTTSPAPRAYGPPARARRWSRACTFASTRARCP